MTALTLKLIEISRDTGTSYGSFSHYYTSLDEGIECLLKSSFLKESFINQARQELLNKLRKIDGDGVEFEYKVLEAKSNLDKLSVIHNKSKHYEYGQLFIKITFEVQKYQIFYKPEVKIPNQPYQAASSEKQLVNVFLMEVEHFICNVEEKTLNMNGVPSRYRDEFENSDSKDITSLLNALKDLK